MLNGLAPFFLFKFPSSLIPSIPISGIPLIGDVDLGGVIPIPLYLDENLTGICLTSQERSIDMDTQVDQSADGKTIVKQHGVSNIVTVNLLAEKEALLLSVLLAFSDKLFQKAVNGKYSISYFNGNTLIFDGKVHSFSAQDAENDTLVRITITIQKTNQETLLSSSAVSVNPLGGSAAGPGL